MKHEKLIYSSGALIIFAAAIMKILHLPYANSILLIGFIGMGVFQSWHVAVLKKRIQELEAKHSV
jgi:hypothetical protein